MIFIKDDIDGVGKFIFLNSGSNSNISNVRYQVHKYADFVKLLNNDSLRWADHVTLMLFSQFVFYIFKKSQAKG